MRNLFNSKIVERTTLMYNNTLHAHAISPVKAPRLRAARIIRVSSAEQAAEARNGLARQRTETDRVIRAKDYDLVMDISLIDVCGQSTFLSPEMCRLVERVENHEIDVIVVSEMSRLIRPNLSEMACLAVFQQHNVLIDCAGTSYNLASAEGFLAGGIQALLGGHERMAMLRKMLQSKESSRAAGHCPSSAITLPHGLLYDRTSNQFRYNPESIWQVIEAFRLVDEEGVRNLCEIGRRTGIHHRTVKNWLSNKAYIGIREYTQMRDQSRKATKPNGRQADKFKVDRPPEAVIRVRICSAEDQAVSDERFARVQLVLAEMADHHARFIAPMKGCNLASGIGRCGFCGERLYTATSSSGRGENNRKARGFYICKSSNHQFRKRLEKCNQGWIPKNHIDALLSRFAVTFLEDKEFLTAVLNHARSKQHNSIVQMSAMPSAIRDKLADLGRRDRRILDAIEAGAISLAEAKERRLRLEEERRGLVQTLELSEKQDDDTQPKGLIGRIAKGTAAWEAAETPQERKKLLSAMFMEVYFQGTSITAFRLAPSLVGNDSGEWSWVADVAVVLPVPFRITPAPQKIEVPDGSRICPRCHEILPEEEFYGAKRSACKNCERQGNRNRARAKVAARKSADSADQAP